MTAESYGTVTASFNVEWKAIVAESRNRAFDVELQDIGGSARGALSVHVLKSLQIGR